MTKTEQLILGGIAGVYAALLALAIISNVDAQSGPTHLGRTFPSGSQVFRPFLGDDRYAVVYMPLASGGGLYFQPFQPAPGQREPNGVAVVVQPGIYGMFGNGCELWLNHSGNAPLREGWLIADNVSVVEIPTTSGRNESWLAVLCGGGSSSFSLSPVR